MVGVSHLILGCGFSQFLVKSITLVLLGLSLLISPVVVIIVIVVVSGRRIVVLAVLVVRVSVG